MPTYETTKFLSLPQQVNKNKNDIKELQDNQADISNLIPNTEKGQPLGVATLDAAGKVPSAQLPSNPGQYLPLAGGLMEGSINMDGYDLSNAYQVEAGVVFTNDIDSLSGEIQVEVPLRMNANKITGAAKGTTNGDVATVDNIQDHNTSPFAHADIRNLISAIQGAYIYRGVINENTIDVTQINLNARILVLMGRAAILGDVLTDLDRTDWYFDGTSWDNMGQTFVVLASAVNDGLMSKEDYTKLFDLYTKAQLDATFEVLANKATDFAVVNDTKYPTTKAVAERLLNLPIAELNNHTLREVFEGANKINVASRNAHGGFGSFTDINGVITFTFSSIPTISLAYFRFDTTFTVGNYYISYELKPKYTLRSRFALGNIDLISPVGYFEPNIYKRSSHLGKLLSQQSVLYMLGNFNETPYVVGDTIMIKNVFVINTDELDISSLTVSQMDYWFNVYQQLQINDANAIFSLFAPKQLEAWLTPTLTGATSTYIRYRKDTLGSVIVEGNITVGTSGTNFTMPTGYRPLFAYTVGILTFNTDGTVVSSATGSLTLSVRYTGA